MASAHGVVLRGRTLHATLRTKSGRLLDTFIDLDVCVENVDGVLKFRGRSEHIFYSASFLSLSGSVLQGFCLFNDGKFHYSEIDLNRHYSNVSGSFTSTYSEGHFYHTARDVRLEVAEGKVMLRAQLDNGKHGWHDDEVDLSTCILNNGRGFTYVKHDGAFNRDGWITTTLVKFPFVGFAVAGVHHLAGNGEWAKRALALCTNSSIVCVGIVVGSLLGPVGAMIGAGIATPIGICVETFRVKKTINNPALRAQFEEATIGRYIYETLRNIFATGCAGYFAKFIERLELGSLAAMDSDITRAFEKLGVTAADFAVYALVKKIADTLVKNKLPLEWLEAEKAVKKTKEN